MEFLEKNNEDDKKKSFFFEQRKFSEPDLISKGNKSGLLNLIDFIMKILKKKGKAQDITIS